MRVATRPVSAKNDAIEQRMIDLRKAADDYVSGRIDVKQYEEREQALLPDYDAMGKHLYRVAKAGNTRGAHQRESPIDRIYRLIRPQRLQKKRA